MLNQSVGDFSHATIRSDARIWVAGCGTNQAIYTALKFPRASVLGSDLSAASLEVARRNAQSLDIRNLELRQESLQDVSYDAEFDYIISTGVIHHNADPRLPLAGIARALRREGILELMVYNRFHRVFNTSVQQAIRHISRHEGKQASFDEELRIARNLLDVIPGDPRRVEYYRSAHDAEVADSLIQPIEFSYTVETLKDLAACCGLSLLLPCPNPFDKLNSAFWSIRLADVELQKKLDALPDTTRWQITNLLQMECSPMLWFYLKHSTERHPDRYEAIVDQAFLDRRFVPTATKLRNYFRGASDMNYRMANSLTTYPAPPQDELLKRILALADGRRTMHEILTNAQVDIRDRKSVSDIRIRTTTGIFPYLRAIT
ncbi:class I SAM-dependent methyltransferase [Dyella flagellata]|nr:class I SAM-dependent methyltransferase [Dyella flagellata]